MLKIRTSALVPLFALVVTPATALADSEWHFTGGEVGYSYFPNHGKGTATRAEVLRELEQAKADGTYFNPQRAWPAPARTAIQGKTREEVINELVSMTPEERARMKELYSGG